MTMYELFQDIVLTAFTCAVFSTFVFEDIDYLLSNAN